MQRMLRRTLLVPALLAGSVTLAWLRAWAEQGPSDRLPQDQGLLYRLDVDLVLLSITARDAQGALVPDVVPEELEIFEDGARQEVVHFGHHETPISAVLLLDKSQSMEDEKLMHAKDALVNFVRAFRPEDEVLVMSFSNSIDVLGDFGLDAKTIERAIKRIEFESTTRLYDAVMEASREIVRPGRTDKRALVILSDDEDTASTTRLDEAVEAIKKAQVPVYAIGIELEDKASAGASLGSPWTRLRGTPAIEALKRLTDGSGGWTYPIAASRRCREVCLRIADELRHQYLLGYYPKNRTRDGQWRTISVRATRPGISLTTRRRSFATGSRRRCAERKSCDAVSTGGRTGDRPTVV